MSTFPSAGRLAADLASGTTTSRALVEESLARADQMEGRLNAFLARTPERALATADAVDARRAGGERLPAVAGVPVAVKDVLSTRGVTTTCGSKMLEGYVPPYDATVWARLDAEGVPLLGKTNCDEFAMGSSNENSAFGPVANPWGLDRVPGGSSGGSAASVAAGEAVWALGTDTGGSVRQPAALCGVVGLKPTYGLLSRSGLIAFASSLDTVGTFTRTVGDAAMLLTAMVGRDPLDATSLEPSTLDYSVGIDEGIRGLRIGVVREAFGDGVEPGVRDAVTNSLERLAALGAEIDEVSLAHADYALSAYYLIAPSEASSNLARFDGVRYGLRVEGGDSVEMMTKTRGAGFGPEVKRRIMLGTYALSAGYFDAYYGQAQKVRTLIIRDYAAAFAGHDLLVSPTSPTTAFRIGERTDDPLAMYLSDVFTIPANLAGVPAISVPCGFDGGGLPVGLQFTAPLMREDLLLRAGVALEGDLALDLVPPLVGQLGA